MIVQIRDNNGFFYFKLKDIFNYYNIDLSTCDINNPNESDIVIYHGLAQKFIDYGYDKSYLLAIESPHIDRKAFDKKNINILKRYLLGMIG